MQIILK